MNKQTEKMTKSLMDFFTSFVVVIFYIVYAHTVVDSFFQHFFCLFASFAWCKNFLINVLNFTRKKEQREESNLTYINDVLEQNHISRVFCYRSSIVNCRSGVKV